MIFDRRPIPPGAPAEMHDLERRLAALAGPVEPGELAGEAAALVAFARLASPAGISRAATRPAPHRLPRRPARGRLALAAALVVVAAGLGSTTAAYNGVLPGPLQQMAHVTVGAPAPRPHGSHQPSHRSRTRSGADQTLVSSIPRQASPVPTATASSQPNLADPRHWPLRHTPRPAVGICTPRPYPTQHPSGPASGVPSWAPPSPGAAGCPVIPIPTARVTIVPTAVAGPGQ
jgi:hypothetical protein